MAKTRNPALEEKRRAQILATVADLLARGPYHEMTLERVAQEAGVSKGLVTYYFQSKDDLIIEAIRRYHGEQRDALLAIVRLDLPAPDRLAMLVEAAFFDRESVEREVRFQVEVWSFAKTRPDVWEAIAESYRAFRAACTELLTVGGRDGYLDAAERDHLYLLLHALVDGLTFQVALDPELDLETVRTALRGAIGRLARTAG